MAAMHSAIGTILTAQGTHELELRTANNFLTRFRGLMLSQPLGSKEGLLITNCSGVHSAFMRYPIDIVYLDRNGTVIQCVQDLKPWRASQSGLGRPRAAHTLELAAGVVVALGIAPGDGLSHPCLAHPVQARVQPAGRQTKERGSAMIEFTVVGPLIALLGLGILQYGMVFFAKNQINYAAFMAAREGAVAHADLAAVQQAYVRALAPLYGGGETPAELAQSTAKASADMAGNMQIEMLNPTKESFSDWNDEMLQTLLKTGNRHVIPNSALAARLNQTNEVRASSGQSLQDANLLKLKITHGYLPKVPVLGKLYLTYLKWADQQTEAIQTKLINDGRIPIVTHITIEMQSDAIEPDSPLSIPGTGNDGHPSNPGTAPVTQAPLPDCTTLNCEMPAPEPASEPEPACNPFTDPNHCQQPECVPNDQMCCMPRQ